jgi:hypothetical protein
VSDTGSPEPLVKVREFKDEYCYTLTVVTGHNFESILPKDHSCHVCFKLADWFQKRSLLNNFPIGSYVKTMSVDGGHFEPIGPYGKKCFKIFYSETSKPI